MAYSDFTLSDLRTQFKIENRLTALFDQSVITPIQASPTLQQQLQEASELPIKSEKARSELIITPILLELRRLNNKFFTIYSGDSLVADKSKGLTGECDFILAKETGSFSVNVPILTIVEAKKQDIEIGINQCAAQLYGAQLFNQQSGTPLEQIYGCVTTADNWKFMRLTDRLVEIDQQTYYKNDIAQILGVLQWIISYYKTVLTAYDPV